jgi:hypothetical protein
MYTQRAGDREGGGNKDGSLPTLRLRMALPLSTHQFKVWTAISPGEKNYDGDYASFGKYGIMGCLVLYAPRPFQPNVSLFRLKSSQSTPPSSEFR